MPSNLGFPLLHVDINIGYDGTRFFVSDATGNQETNVDRIGGQAGTIKWKIFNRTKMNLQFRIDNFRRDALSTCPVAGGDFSGLCEYESLQEVPPDGFDEVETGLIGVQAQEIHEYDLKVRQWGATEWQFVDPELQIDP